MKGIETYLLRMGVITPVRIPKTYVIEHCPGKCTVEEPAGFYNLVSYPYIQLIPVHKENDIIYFKLFLNDLYDIENQLTNYFMEVGTEDEDIKSKVSEIVREDKRAIRKNIVPWKNKKLVTFWKIVKSMEMCHRRRVNNMIKIIEGNKS